MSRIPEPLLAEMTAGDAAAACQQWLDVCAPLAAERWCERTGFIDGAIWRVVDIQRAGQRLTVTVALDYQTVVNLGCSVQREPRRAWLVVTIDTATGAWSAAPRFAEVEEPEF